jgi:hypothetical protein
MKFKVILTTVAIILTASLTPLASASQVPIVESFTFTPNELDLLSADTTIKIELVVSHPAGISNTSSIATLSGAGNNTLSTYLTRIDSPINTSLTKVTFRGNITLPRDIGTGVYNLTSTSITNNSTAGYQFGTGIIETKKIRNLIGAESGLLVRAGNQLGLNYQTFVGPSYDRTAGISFNDPATYNSSNTPIWKVGETFLPEKYYELRVPTLTLVIRSASPSTCTSDGKQLKIIKEGVCNFIVSTEKTNDYLARSSDQTVTITSARPKPELTIYNIANQTSKDLPKLLEIGRVYSPSEGYVFPQSTTPLVCVGSGFYVRIVSGGTCTLTYQTKDTETYLASDLYKVTFEIVRDLQTISFTPPATVNISAKTLALSATASGGGVITYQTTSTGICSITGSTLNLLKGGNCAITATQAGSATFAPISATATVMIAGSTTPTKKTITCVKGNKTKKVSGINPKCPKGYKIKR